LASSQAGPYTLEKVTTKGNDHRGPRGERGRKGKPGKNVVTPAYIARAEIIEEQIAPFHLTMDTILPLGNSDTGLTPVLLEYVDPTPTVPTSDRFVRVLPGGAGTYLIEWSITALSDLSTSTVPLYTRLEVGNSEGAYDQSRAPDEFFPISSAASSPVVFSTGTRTDIVTLKEGDQVHIRVVEDPAPDLALQLMDDNARSVNFTMSRIESPK
jgi:hypothetical protein